VLDPFLQFTVFVFNNIFLYCARSFLLVFNTATDRYCILCPMLLPVILFLLFYYFNRCMVLETGAYSSKTYYSNGSNDLSIVLLQSDQWK
jgi:hypothetical protein